MNILKRKPSPRTNVVFSVSIFGCFAAYQVYRYGMWDWWSLLWVAYSVFFIAHAVWRWRHPKPETEPEPEPKEPPKTVSNRQVLGLIAVVTMVIAVLALISSLRGEPKSGLTNMCYVRTSDSSLTTQPGIPWCAQDVTVPN